MQDEIILPTIVWQGPEYTHQEKTVDFLWTIGLIAIVLAGLAVWNANYLFAIFILLSACCLILFSVRPPQIVNVEINTDGIKIGRSFYVWKSVAGFHIIKGTPYAKLLLKTKRQFLPVLTITIPAERVSETRTTLLKVIPDIELAESRSMQFMEKLGF